MFSLSAAYIQKDSWMESSGGPKPLPELLGSKQNKSKDEMTC